MLFYIHKGLRRMLFFIMHPAHKLISLYLLKGNKVRHKHFYTAGIPYIVVAKGGKMSIGTNFIMVNGIHANPIGCYQKCTFFVDSSATLTIGENVGISQAAIVCHQQITIGNDVKIGGGVKIFDTDFHSLDPKIRNSKEDINHRAKAPVNIKDRAFIGADTIILKGVTIGENAVVGAGSVVAKSVPDNQIWAGNPAKYIKEI